MTRTVLICIGVMQAMLALPAAAQSDYPWLRLGDELYAKGAYPDAEIAYRKALEEKQKPGSSYNLGNAVYRQRRMDEAIKQYESSVASVTDPALRAKGYYNLGNAHFQNQAFDKSVAAYKESLKLNPDDDDARHNLMLAMRQLQMQQQQQENREQQENQDQKEQQQAQPQEEQGRTENDQEEMLPEELSREEAKEILKAIEREDQRVQEKLKQPARKSPPVKDW